MKKFDPTFLSCTGILFYTLVLSITASLFDGWVLVQLWTWFAVRYFGLPVITVAEGIGLSLLVALLTHQRQKADKSDDDESVGLTLIKGAILSFAQPAMFLFIAWIVQSYVTVGAK